MEENRIEDEAFAADSAAERAAERAGERDGIRAGRRSGERSAEYAGGRSAEYADGRGAERPDGRGSVEYAGGRGAERAGSRDAARGAGRSGARTERSEGAGSRDSEERAVLVAVVCDREDARRTEEYLDELEFLAETAGIRAVRRFTQRMPQPSSRIYVGPGKLEEIAGWCEEHAIDVVIFDDELSPSQTRNIEKAMPCRILDRTRLILDIFLSRARTAYAKTQVQLANYEYMLPRLSGLWTHLERQRGGTGTRGGAGEREIETDRRIIRSRIARLKEELQKIDRQMAVQRSNRGSLVRVALVGYTNVGKSTLMNLISKSEVFAENKLFATLDTTVRKVVFDNLPFLLSDTVGFIRKLPTELIESFKSTLDEVREADLLVHVVDVSHPQFEEQIDVVKQTLQEIGAGDKPVYLVFNKVDAYTYIKKEEDDLTPATRENRSLEELKHSWFARGGAPCIFLSALTRVNIDKFRTDLYGMVREIHAGRYPFNNFLY